MEKVKSNYYCETCNKNYKSIYSLSNHKRRYHPKNEPNISINEQILSQNTTFLITEKKFNCRYCSKNYKHIQSKNRHEKKCKLSDAIEKETLKKENELLKEKTRLLEERFESEIKELRSQLRELINKKGKIHYKTLQKINKQNNIETQNNTQNIQQNINIIGFNKENLNEIFSSNEKLNILKHRFGSLNQLIEYTHFNDKYPELKNIKITNLNNNIAYKYDENKKKFIATTKEDLISNLITSRMYDIETFSLNEELDNKLSQKDKAVIQKFIDQFYEDEDLFVDNRKDDIKFIIYNGCEQI